MNIHLFDVVIIGAGAAGLMCAIEAGKRKRKVLVLEQANKPGKKILMSGGGRCNFTNYGVHPDNYISHNPHFCKSALARYTQWDFIQLVNSHHIPFHEKTLGQLFCDEKSQAILSMLLNECRQVDVTIALNSKVDRIEALTGGFQLIASFGKIQCESLVVATGGLSIPTMGASPYGYHIAKQFCIPVWPTRAGLVPFTLSPEDKTKFESLAGVSLNANVSHAAISFSENILFTHRGLSGPAILQISSYWQPNTTIAINLLPGLDAFEFFKEEKLTRPQKQLKSILTVILPKRFVEVILPTDMGDKKLADLSHQQLKKVADHLQIFSIMPNGTEGYRTAEVTIGGVDCSAISSKTMAAKTQPNLYFIGEVLDVTGWLGGYNFQWAWSSGWVAGQVV